MGITKKALGGAASTLFSSTQRDLLGLLYGQPEREFLGAELIRLVGRGTGAVHRQLKQFAAGGLVTVTKRANQTYYKADARNPIYPELRGIILKTVGLAEPLRAALAPFEKEIVAAFVFGSMAAGREGSRSDVDLMILTRTAEGLSYTELYEELGKVERVLARPVNPILMTMAEYQRKRVIEESFVERVDAGPKIMLVGEGSDVG